MFAALIVIASLIGTPVPAPPQDDQAASIPIYTEEQTPTAPKVKSVLGRVWGASCKARPTDPDASTAAAQRDLRNHALHLGANGVIGARYLMLDLLPDCLGGVGVEGTAVIFLLAVFPSSAKAGLAEDRAHRDWCLQRMESFKNDGRFDIPPAYRSASEPGGLSVVKRDGAPWHPAFSDIRRLGARIETSPTDNLEILALASMDGVKVEGGRVYSRIECDRLNCLFKVAFVPDVESAVATDCGVGPSYLRIVGVSDQGLAAARRAIRFRWGAKGSVSLADLGPRR